MTDIKELRTRARAIGYKTIHRRGDTYWLINTDGVNEAGATGLDAMDNLLSGFEATKATLDAGGIVIYSTACGIPESAHDRDGEIGLDDHRVVALLKEKEGVPQSIFNRDELWND
jgi:hypothetical protein